MKRNCQLQKMMAVQGVAPVIPSLFQVRNDQYKPSRCDLNTNQKKLNKHTHPTCIISTVCGSYTAKNIQKGHLFLNFHCLDVAEDFHRHLGVEFHAGNRFVWNHQWFGSLNHQWVQGTGSQASTVKLCPEL